MFFKKRREEKRQKRAAAEQAAEQARVETVKGFREKLDAAQRIPDPVERCLALMDVSAEAGKVRNACASAIAKRGQDIKEAPAITLGILLGGAGLALGPLCIFTGGAGYCWGESLGAKRADKVTARLRARDKTLLDGLGEIVDQARAAYENILTIDPRELSRCPKAEDLMLRVPKLKDDMLEAFRKNPPSRSLPPPGQGPKTGGFRL
jgi:hypothetical protein